MWYRCHKMHITATRCHLKTVALTVALILLVLYMYKTPNSIDGEGLSGESRAKRRQLVVNVHASKPYKSFPYLRHGRSGAKNKNKTRTETTTKDKKTGKADGKPFSLVNTHKVDNKSKSDHATSKDEHFLKNHPYERLKKHHRVTSSASPSSSSKTEQKSSSDSSKDRTEKMSQQNDSSRLGSGNKPSQQKSVKVETDKSKSSERDLSSRSSAPREHASSRSKQDIKAPDHKGSPPNDKEKEKHESRDRDKDRDDHEAERRPKSSERERSEPSGKDNSKDEVFEYKKNSDEKSAKETGKKDDDKQGNEKGIQVKPSLISTTKPITATTASSAKGSQDKTSKGQNEKGDSLKSIDSKPILSPLAVASVLNINNSESIKSDVSNKSATKLVNESVPRHALTYHSEQKTKEHDSLSEKATPNSKMTSRTVTGSTNKESTSKNLDSHSDTNLDETRQSSQNQAVFIDEGADSKSSSDGIGAQSTKQIEQHLNLTQSLGNTQPQININGPSQPSQTGQPSQVNVNGPGQPSQVNVNGSGQPSQVNVNGPGQPSQVNVDGPGQPSQVNVNGPGQPSQVNVNGPGQPSQVNVNGPSQPPLGQGEQHTDSAQLPVENGGNQMLNSNSQKSPLLSLNFSGIQERSANQQLRFEPQTTGEFQNSNSMNPVPNDNIQSIQNQNNFIAPHPNQFQVTQDNSVGQSSPSTYNVNQGLNLRNVTLPIKNVGTSPSERVLSNNDGSGEAQEEFLRPNNAPISDLSHSDKDKDITNGDGAFGVSDDGGENGKSGVGSTGASSENTLLSKIASLDSMTTGITGLVGDNALEENRTDFEYEAYSNNDDYTNEDEAIFSADAGTFQPREYDEAQMRENNLQNFLASKNEEGGDVEGIGKKEVYDDYYADGLNDTDYLNNDDYGGYDNPQQYEEEINEDSYNDDEIGGNNFNQGSKPSGFESEHSPTGDVSLGNVIKKKLTAEDISLLLKYGAKNDKTELTQGEVTGTPNQG